MRGGKGIEPGAGPVLMLVFFLVGCGSSAGDSGAAGGPGGPGTGGAATGTGGRGGGPVGTGGGASSSGGASATGGRNGGGGAAAASGGSTSVGGTGGGGDAAGGGGAPGSGGTPPFGGRSGSGGQAGSSGGRSGSGGAPGSGGADGAGGAPGGCGAPVNCGTHRWACWRMPNPPGSGLPNPASYTDLGDGTVRDNVTCLTWQKAVSAASYTVAAGRAYCANLGTGWRLATRIELMSIMDFTQSAAKADPTAFPGTPRAFFKTGSEWVLTTKQIGVGAGRDLGWAFNFSDGIVSNARSAATPDRARCVRGTGDADLDAAPGALSVAPPNHYTVVAAGEVKDNYTGLVWQQGSSPTQMSFADAKTYCANLGLNGQTWRLPSIREASTLVDEAQVAPSIDRTMFPGTRYGARSNNWYWSSHNAAGSTTAAWALNFDDGFTGANTATDSAAWNYFTAVWARCVR